MPGLRWCIRDREDEAYRRWPRRNTWRSAYNTLRGMNAFGSYYGYEEAEKQVNVRSLYRVQRRLESIRWLRSSSTTDLEGILLNVCAEAVLVEARWQSEQGPVRDTRLAALNAALDVLAALAVDGEGG